MLMESKTTEFKREGCYEWEIYCLRYRPAGNGETL